MENRINTILELDDNRKYIVINQAIYKNDSYLLVNEVNEDESDLLEEVLVLKEIKRGEETLLEIVIEPNLLDLLLKYLTPKK